MDANWEHAEGGVEPGWVGPFTIQVSIRVNPGCSSLIQVPPPPRLRRDWRCDAGCRHRGARAVGMLASFLATPQERLACFQDMPPLHGQPPAPAPAPLPIVSEGFARSLCSLASCAGPCRRNRESRAKRFREFHAISAHNAEDYSAALENEPPFSRLLSGAKGAYRGSVPWPSPGFSRTHTLSRS